MHGGCGNLDDLMEPLVRDLELLEAFVRVPTLDPAIRDVQCEDTWRVGGKEARCRMLDVVEAGSRR